MCRHLPNTICGKDVQFYEKRLESGRQFPLLLCEATAKDITYIIDKKKGQVDAKTIATACGLQFDRDELGRMLFDKFLQQVQSIQQQTTMRKSNGKVVTFLDLMKSDAY
ncbi:hypothetical protein F53441_1294 [Fusarium austroafricanum]|uniref:Uncharacterized protein n=1 Tax=Fusarium austroafricanum TaxID=2364996 RepID=A0A8H4KTV1_9HYPO|nr:hypothetical protein F53441_1294 [Fusarium austroafricanum]